MMYPVPFKAEHFGAMRLYDTAAWLSKMANVDDMRHLEGDYACTLMRDGKPVLCGGVAPLWKDRALAWSFFDSTVSTVEFSTVHRYVKTFLDNVPFRRVEAAVDADFEAGHRWARALGFECETPPPACMKAFQPDGTDCLLYARVKEAA